MQISGVHRLDTKFPLLHSSKHASEASDALARRWFDGNSDIHRVTGRRLYITLFEPQWIRPNLFLLLAFFSGIFPYTLSNVFSFLFFLGVESDFSIHRLRARYCNVSSRMKPKEGYLRAVYDSFPDLGR